MKGCDRRLGDGDVRFVDAELPFSFVSETSTLTVNSLGCWYA